MIGFGKTDIGRRRELNEDSIFVSNIPVGELPNLYIVADGMGGHNAGEIASSLSVEYFCEFISNNSLKDDEILDTIVGGVKYANDKVYQESLKNESYSNMGTTFLASVIKNDRIYIAHVGDCRLYKSNSNEMLQITTDHTYVMEMLKAGEISFDEAQNNPKSNIITRAVGVDSDVNVDGLFCDISENDRIILCSDGLYGMLTDKEIFDIISDTRFSVEEKVGRLIESALSNGGKDNISVIVIE